MTKKYIQYTFLPTNWIRK